MKFHWFFLMFLIAFSFFFDVKMFVDKDGDGFFNQVNFVFNNFDNPAAYSPLFFVHALRLLTIAPFFVTDLFSVSVYLDYFLYFIYVRGTRSVCAYFDAKYIYYLVLLLPFVFSLRSSLGMVAILYLFYIVYARVRSDKLFLFSALISNLSSGTLLAFFSIFIFFSKMFLCHYKKLIPFFIVIIVGFLFSVSHKIAFMFLDSGVAENGWFFERSTLYVSYVYGQYYRLIFYSLLLFVLLLLFVVAFMKDNSDSTAVGFFLSSVPLIFFEGIGFLSFMIAMIVYLRISLKLYKSR